MKEHHSCAVAIDSKGNRTRYLLRKASIDEVSRQKASPEPVLILNEAQFREYVKANRVQLFQDLGHGPQNIHTEEELCVYQKAFKRAGGITDDSNYWQSEVTFLDNCLDEDRAVNVALVTARKMKLLDQYIIQGAVYSKNFDDDLTHKLDGHALTITAQTPDLVFCNWTLPQLITFLSMMHDRSLTVCTQTMRHLDSVVYQVRMLGFQNVNQTELDNIIKQIRAAVTPA